MMYATETVLALHRARAAEEQRSRTERGRREEPSPRPDRPSVELRPVPAR